MITDKEPDNFENPLIVVGCFVNVDDEYLLLQRQDHDSLPNKWGLPAGGVLKTESLLEGMKRELFEETGIHVTDEDLSYFSKAYTFGNNDRSLIFHMFRLNLDEKPEVILDPEEHKNFMWIKSEGLSEVDYIYGLDYCFDMLKR